MTQVEIAAELYKQTAFSASILGGFALTFLSILMTVVDSDKRVYLVAIGALTTSSVLLLVATIGATYILIAVQQMQLTFSFDTWPPQLYRAKWIAELSFLFGIITLLCGIGLSGFAKNNKVGRVTLIPACFATLLLLLIFVI